MELPVDQTIQALLNGKLSALEKYLKADVLCFYGPIQDGFEPLFKGEVEELASNDKQKILCIVLTTPGGSALAVERFVKIVRHHYEEVYFIVPNFAYSAGTIFCMSGDKIFMDYFSVLGPIDPQVLSKEGKLVPALGYLDKINELIKKAQEGNLTQAEFVILKEFDLAELRAFEQAKELTIDQLKNWLVQYKFKNWNTHKDGRHVTEKEKAKRAEEIAGKLSDSNLWKHHGRPIDITKLRELSLIIEDFGEDKELCKLIKEYDQFIIDYINKNGYRIYIHTRRRIWHP